MLAGAACGAPAQSQPLDRRARTWAASCVTCHGPGDRTDGRAEDRAKGGPPSLGGRDADSLYRTLIEFKTGQRPAATVMHQLTKGYTDDELLRIARAFATATTATAK